MEQASMSLLFSVSHCAVHGVNVVWNIQHEFISLEIIYTPAIISAYELNINRFSTNLVILN